MDVLMDIYRLNYLIIKWNSLLPFLIYFVKLIDYHRPIL